MPKGYLTSSSPHLVLHAGLGAIVHWGVEIRIRRWKRMKQKGPFIALSLSSSLSRSLSDKAFGTFKTNISNTKEEKLHKSGGKMK